MVGNRQAGEHAIMLWVIWNVERVAIDGGGAFDAGASAERERWAFFTRFQGTVIPDRVTFTGRMVLEWFTKEDGIDIKGWPFTDILKTFCERDALSLPLDEAILLINNLFQIRQWVEDGGWGEIAFQPLRTCDRCFPGRHEERSSGSFPGVCARAHGPDSPLPCNTK